MSVALISSRESIAGAVAGRIGIKAKYLNPLTKDIKTKALNKIEPLDKWYLKDLCLLGLIDAIREIVKDGNDFKGELQPIHKNKKRKERRKINESLEKYSDLRERLLLKISNNDLHRLQKITFKLAPYFFKESDKLVKPNLELLCVYLLFIRFVDERPKTPHEDFISCTNIKEIFSIGNLIEKAQIKDAGKEYRFARALLNKLNKA